MRSTAGKNDAAVPGRATRAATARLCRATARLAAAALGLAACMAAQAATLSGSAFTGDLDVLPRQATFEAQLLQLNSRDEVTKVLGSVRVERPAPGIVSFELEYEPADIDASQRHAVSARIHVNGKLLFVSEQRTSVTLPAEAGGAPAIVLRMVRAATPAPTPAPAASAASQAGADGLSPFSLSPDDL